MVSYRKMLPNFQVVVTTGPLQCMKPGPSLGTHAGTQAAHSLNRMFYFMGRNSFLGGGGRVKEGVKR